MRPCGSLGAVKPRLVRRKQERRRPGWPLPQQRCHSRHLFGVNCFTSLSTKTGRTRNARFQRRNLAGPGVLRAPSGNRTPLSKTTGLQPATRHQVVRRMNKIVWAHRETYVLDTGTGPGPTKILYGNRSCYLCVWLDGYGRPARPFTHVSVGCQRLLRGDHCIASTGARNRTQSTTGLESVRLPQPHRFGVIQLYHCMPVGEALPPWS